jgi:hypothetical protein
MCYLKPPQRAPRRGAAAGDRLARRCKMRGVILATGQTLDRGLVLPGALGPFPASGQKRQSRCLWRATRGDRCGIDRALPLSGWGSVAATGSAPSGGGLSARTSGLESQRRTFGHLSREGCSFRGADPSRGEASWPWRPGAPIRQRWKFRLTGSPDRDCIANRR